MSGLDQPGSEVWLSRSRNPARKLNYTWELLRVGGGLVGINTGRTNGLVEEAVRAGRIPELRGYERVRREVRYGRPAFAEAELRLRAGPHRPIAQGAGAAHLLRRGQERLT